MYDKQVAIKVIRIGLSTSFSRVWYLKSLEAWHRIDHPPVAPAGFDAGDPAKVAKSLQFCDAALAKRTPSVY
jgi:hypothetical protein